MKHNTINLYKHVCEMVENPKGADSLERANVRAKAIKTKASIEEHFRTARKYKDDPEIQALLNPKEEVKEEEETKSEVKKNDKGRNKSA